jgi:hypothetical protein
VGACAADAAIATLLLVLVEPAGWLALLLRGVSVSGSDRAPESEAPNAPA